MAGSAAVDWLCAVCGHANASYQNQWLSGDR